MRAALVLDAVRTPIGARGGSLSGWHPADLAAELLRALVERTGIDPATVDDVVLGCAMPVGSQGMNVARSAVLAAGWPDHVPAGTVDRQGLSGLAAVLDAARAVASGACDVVVAGGVEIMSTTPQGATLVPGAMPFGPAVAERYRDAGGLVPAGLAAEALTASLGLDRAALDALALAAHGRFRPGAELVPVATKTFDRDKGEVVRPGTTVKVDEQVALANDDLAAAKPAFTPDGAITALNSAPIGDGAAAVLVVSEAVAERLDRAPLARIAGGALTGVDPIEALTGAEPAVGAVLARAGLTVGDVDRYEVAEPFAAVVVHLERALGIEVNPAGGGLAIGEPTGASGARLVATLAAGLTGRWGIAAAAGAGLGGAVLLERA